MFLFECQVRNVSASRSLTNAGAFALSVDSFQSTVMFRHVTLSRYLKLAETSLRSTFFSENIVVCEENFGIKVKNVRKLVKINEITENKWNISCKMQYKFDKQFIQRNFGKILMGRRILATFTSITFKVTLFFCKFGLKLRFKQPFYLFSFIIKQTITGPTWIIKHLNHIFGSHQSVSEKNIY